MSPTVDLPTLKPSPSPCMDESDDAVSACRAITILDTIDWTVKAWKALQGSTITKCFSACCFSSASADSDDDDDVPLADLVVSQFRFRLDELEAMDEDIVTEDNEWERDLVSCFSKESSIDGVVIICLLYTSPSPRDLSTSRMPSSA